MWYLKSVVLQKSVVGMGVKGVLTLLNCNITLKVWGLPLLKHFYLSNSKERKVKVLVTQSSSTL